MNFLLENWIFNSDITGIFDEINYQPYKNIATGCYWIRPKRPFQWEHELDSAPFSPFLWEKKPAP